MCALRSSRMRAEQHKLVRSLWRRILEVGWALVLCVLGVHGHFDTTEIQSNFTQVENTCAVSGTSARPNLNSTAASYGCWCIDEGCARH
jgi:hypothetical protein